MQGSLCELGIRRKSHTFHRQVGPIHNVQVRLTAPMSLPEFPKLGAVAQQGAMNIFPNLKTANGVIIMDITDNKMPH
jgi:hypothetical protein